MMNLRLALRELKNNWRFTVFFATNLAAGLVGLCVVEGLRYSLKDALAGRSQQMLAADLSVSARRELSVAERIAAAEVGQITAILDMYSMVQSPISKRSRLGQLRGIEATYPWYGEIQLQKRGIQRAGAGAALQKRVASVWPAWVDEGLARELGIKIGDAFSAGGIKLHVADLVVSDSTNAIASFALGPRIYVASQALAGTTLLGKGATATRALLLKISKDADLADAETRLNRELPDPAIRIRTHVKASEESSRLFSYLNDYLGLVSLSALLLAALGAVFQFRRFFLAKAKSIGILLSLGVTRRRAFWIFTLQLLITGVIAAIAAAAISAALLPILSTWFEGFVPAGTVEWRLNGPAAAIGLSLGIVASLLLCLPQLTALNRFSASALFREDFREAIPVTQTHWAWYLPSATAFVGLSVLVSKSFVLGLTFVGGLVFSVGLLAAFGALTLKLLSKLEGRVSTELRLALRHLNRSRSTTWLSCLTIGLAAMLMSLIPQIRSNLDSELHGPDAKLRPSLFLFDIQEDQLEPVRAFLKQSGAEADQISPFIRARLLAVNGKTFEKDIRAGEGFQTREAEQERNLRNRGFNLTYRQKLSASEELREGREFLAPWNPEGKDLPEVSVERHFGDRMGWKLGDRLSFDIMGVSIDAVVVNFRSIRWSTFQPNFFVQFQDGVLEDTPKTFLASVPQVDQETKSKIQDEMVSKFGNVSMIDVGQIIDLFMKLAAQMSAALLLMALFTLGAGVLTFLAIARFESYSRRWDMNLMKILGAGRLRVAKVFLWESALVSSVASIVGASASLAVSFALARFVFDSEWQPDLRMALITAASSVAISLTVTLVSAWGVWREKPLNLLGA